MVPSTPIALTHLTPPYGLVRGEHGRRRGEPLQLNNAVSRWLLGGGGGGKGSGRGGARHEGWGWGGCSRCADCFGAGWHASTIVFLGVGRGLAQGQGGGGMDAGEGSHCC